MSGTELSDVKCELEDALGGAQANAPMDSLMQVLEHHVHQVAPDLAILIEETVTSSLRRAISGRLVWNGAEPLGRGEAAEPPASRPGEGVDHCPSLAFSSTGVSAAIDTRQKGIPGNTGEVSLAKGSIKTARCDGKSPVYGSERGSISRLSSRRPSSVSQEALQMVEAARGDVKPGEEMLQLPLALMETFARAPMPSWAKRRLMPVVASLFQACLWLEKLKEPEHDGYLHAFVKSTCFEAFTAIVILFNAIEAAAAADYEMLSLGTGQNQFIFYSELAMCIFYTVELVLKLRLHGVFFFINEDRVWNFFDLILVVQSMYEQIAIFLLSGGGASLSFMRTFRIMKVVKAFRAIRFIRMFRELRLMMVSLKNSFGSLFWTMIMLVFIFYIFGLIAMQGVSNYLMAEPAVSQEMAEAMLRNFGTMQKSMLTMYKTGTGGADWEAFYDILEQAGTFYAVTYLFFTCFFHISVFNVLTGMFVERVMKLAEPDHDQNVMEWRKERQAQQYEVKKLCKLMDSDNSGTISWEEFEGHLSDERVSAYFASLELDIKHAEMFFHTLVEANDGDEVDIDSFVEGCMQMKGTATSIDLHIVSVQIRNLHRHVKELTQFVADELGAHRPAWNFALGAQRCSRSQARAMENVELWDTDSLTKTMFEPGIHHGSCWRVTEDEAVVQPPVLEEELDWKAGGPYCASAERLAALSESAVFS